MGEDRAFASSVVGLQVNQNQCFTCGQLQQTKKANPRLAFLLFNLTRSTLAW